MDPPGSSSIDFNANEEDDGNDANNFNSGDDETDQQYIHLNEIDERMENQPSSTTGSVTATIESQNAITATVVKNYSDRNAPVVKSPSQQHRPSLNRPIEQENKQHDQKSAALVERLVSELGFPTGLGQRLVTCVQRHFVKHYWLVDNSGSMLTTDCVRMVHRDVMEVGAGNMERPPCEIVKCSRWNELENTLLSHVELARILEIPTTFRLLKGQRGMQEFTINNVLDDIESAKSIIRESEPDGVTLLSEHIIEICNHIEKDKDLLLEKGQKAVVVIATDAVPSDQHGETTKEAKETFVKALLQLQLLPVWIVIRLCTSERKAIDYYRKLDKKLEIPIECVSEYVNEYKEVRKWNPWLNYTPQIHLCREMGFHHRVFDLLDERPFTKDDLHEFLTILFGTEAFDVNVAPNIHNNWDEFLKYLKNQVLSQCEKQYSPITKKFEDIIDVKGLAAAYGMLGSLRSALKF